MLGRRMQSERRARRIPVSATDLRVRVARGASECLTPSVPVLRSHFSARWKFVQACLYASQAKASKRRSVRKGNRRLRLAQPQSASDSVSKVSVEHRR